MVQEVASNIGQTSAFIWAACPQGTHVLGGGMRQTNYNNQGTPNPEEVQLYQSFPTSNSSSNFVTGNPGNNLGASTPSPGDQGWAVEVKQNDSGNNHDITVYALCASTG